MKYTNSWIVSSQTKTSNLLKYDVEKDVVMKNINLSSTQTIESLHSSFYASYISTQIVSCHDFYPLLVAEGKSFIVSSSIFRNVPNKVCFIKSNGGLIDNCTFVDAFQIYISQNLTLINCLFNVRPVFMGSVIFGENNRIEEFEPPAFELADIKIQGESEKVFNGKQSTQIYEDKKRSSIIVKEALFENIHSHSSSGGCISIQSFVDNIVLYNSLFSFCSSSISGGVLHCSNYVNLSIDRVCTVRCSAPINAIAFTDAICDAKSSNLTSSSFQQSIFEDNTLCGGLIRMKSAMLLLANINELNFSKCIIAGYFLSAEEYSVFTRIKRIIATDSSVFSESCFASLSSLEINNTCISNITLSNDPPCLFLSRGISCYFNYLILDGTERTYIFFLDLSYASFNNCYFNRSIFILSNQTDAVFVNHTDSPISYSANKIDCFVYQPPVDNQEVMKIVKIVLSISIPMICILIITIIILFYNSRKVKAMEKSIRFKESIMSDFG